MKKGISIGLTIATIGLMVACGSATEDVPSQLKDYDNAVEFNKCPRSDHWIVKCKLDPDARWANSNPWSEVLSLEEIQRNEICLIRAKVTNYQGTFIRGSNDNVCYMGYGEALVADKAVGSIPNDPANSTHADLSLREDFTRCGLRNRDISTIITADFFLPGFRSQSQRPYCP